MFAKCLHTTRGRAEPRTEQCEKGLGEAMLARELMSTFHVKVSPSASVREAALLMRQESVGIVCACDPSGRPLGVITDRDIAVRVCAPHLSAETTQVQQVMTRNPLTCTEDAPAEEVEATMKQNRVGRMLVVDGQGVMTGIITLAEIWHHESPLTAAPISRTLTERELRAQPSGGHYTARGGVAGDEVR